MMSSRLSLAGLMAIASIAAAGAGVALSSLPPPRKGSSHNYTPPPRRNGTAPGREIAEHNAQVDRLKAEKRARRRA